ncbi:hypothetical protein ALC62_08754 [Cyphomyrmex costatus]|uniref:Ig-like domain-containing protein n=1 Tax=Cyphomyrmex costatus TaxID=456900 RepID=A0A195CI83_9HYME|nr:hypothetical protein ALC62_08754 [Cyphomyrmex costatus]
MFADAMNSLVEDVVVEAGKNVTLGCPGVTEDSLVLMLEWRANGMRLLEYKSRSTTVVRRTEQNRMSLSLKNYSLQLHPVTAADTGMYECLVNNRNTPEAVIKLIVRGSACSSRRTRTTTGENGECSANGLVRFYLMLERRDLFTANSQCVGQSIPLEGASNTVKSVKRRY